MGLAHRRHDSIGPRRAVMERDVVQVLTEDHSVLEWLGDRLRTTHTCDARSLMFNEFARALGAHETVIDETVVPALKSCGWRGLSSDVLTSHSALKRSFAEVLTLGRHDAAFPDVLNALILQLAQHCELERSKLLPVLRDCLDDAQREMMAFDAEAHLMRILGDARPGEDTALAQPANELIEEAQLVLGSLPTRIDRTPPGP
jgi:hypothetical protein